MARTVGVVYDADLDVYDLDGTVPDAIEALRQRILAGHLAQGRRVVPEPQPRAGPQSLIIGHQINAALAAQALSDTIRTEGGGEITGLRDTFFQVDRPSRTLRYRVVVDTIYGVAADGGQSRHEMPSCRGTAIVPGPRRIVVSDGQEGLAPRHAQRGQHEQRRNRIRRVAGYGELSMEGGLSG